MSFVPWRWGRRIGPANNTTYNHLSFSVLLPGGCISDVCSGRKCQPWEQWPQVFRSRWPLHRCQFVLPCRSYILGATGFLVCSGPGLSWCCQGLWRPHTTCVWFCPAVQMAAKNADITFLRCVISVPLFWKRYISQEAYWSKKRWVFVGRGSTVGVWPIPVSLGCFQPARLWLCSTPVGETVTMTGALSAKEDWEIKKKNSLCIAPNHVLLVINLGYPRILSSLIYVHISQAFVERSIGGH